MVDTPRRFSRLPELPPPWQPTHRLRWVPRTGRVVEWLVQVETQQRDCRDIMTARTQEEAQERLPTSWLLDGDTWVWNGRRGFLGADGVAKLLPLRKR